MDLSTDRDTPVVIRIVNHLWDRNYSFLFAVYALHVVRLDECG